MVVVYSVGLDHLLGSIRDQTSEDWCVRPCVFLPWSTAVIGILAQYFGLFQYHALKRCLFGSPPPRVPNRHKYFPCFPRQNLASSWSCGLAYSQLLRCGGGAAALGVSWSLCCGNGSFSFSTVKAEPGDHVRKLHW